MTFDRISVAKPKIGIFGIGLEAYWAQFPGLRDRLLGYQQEIEQNLRITGCNIVSAGLVDNQPAAQEARSLFSREDVDLVICYVGTYATSSQVVPAVQRLRCPILVLNQYRPLIMRRPTLVNGWPIAAPAVSRKFPAHSLGAVLSSTLSAGFCENRMEKPGPLPGRRFADGSGP